MHLWPSLEKSTLKAVRNLVFLLHRPLTRTVSNAGSVKTNAEYRSAVAAIVVSEETKMAT